VKGGVKGLKTPAKTWKVGLLKGNKGTRKEEGQCLERVKTKTDRRGNQVKKALHIKKKTSFEPREEKHRVV